MSEAGPLQTPVRYLKGIGPRRAGALAERGILTVRDLLYYFPYGYLDLSKVESIGSLTRYAGTDELCSAVGDVRNVELLGRPPRQRLVVVLEDGTGIIHLVFFESINYLKKAFTEGETLAVSGKVTRFRNQLQIVHPMIDRLQSGKGEEADGGGFLHTSGIVPKYGSSRELRDVRLHVRGLRQVMSEAVSGYVHHVRDVLPPTLRESYGLVGIVDALRSIHFPRSFGELEAARRRLKFEELYLMQLLLALRRISVRSEMPGFAFRTDSTLARTLVDSLPFTLTAAQVSVIREIASDLGSPRPMNRLLQGDVGSGKTVVALITALIAVDNGYQSALMAPTELLAEQHFRTISGYCGTLDVPVDLLTGSVPPREREAVLGRIEAGESRIVIGTHALIQEGVKFHQLGLVIIDEQHRFGVSQRLALRQKRSPGAPARDLSPQPDLLVMTATPIPRTLSMTLYGDLDVSTIRELPPNRKRIDTSLRFEKERGKVYAFLRDQLSAGRQAYIVYPMVEESEKVDLKAATESYKMLGEEVFPEFFTGLIHGRMPAPEREEVMTAFQRGRIRILVSTTVIEVGIDVPNATVMVIEHAERFGLSQLHQLRGRVGRGSDQSYAILMAPDWMRTKLRYTGSLLGDPAEADEQLVSVRRLAIIRDTDDGFEIAENDLKIRGPGEFFGTRQSGLPRLRIADLLTDGELLETVRREAALTVEEDPQLRLPEHRELRNVVGDEMIELIRLTQSG